jgi:rhodanese-related sulfurtransferase
MKKVFFLSTLLLAGLLSCNSQHSTKTATVTQPQPTETQATTTAGYQDLDVAAFKAKMADPGIVLMDVRTPEETAQGMIEGAMQLDFRNPNFESEVDKLDKDKTYLIYCRSGNRSGQACKMMAGKGFRHLYNLQGGYIDWSKE